MTDPLTTLSFESTPVLTRVLSVLRLCSWQAPDRRMASHADAQQGACVGGRMTACCDGVCGCLFACGHSHAPAGRVAQMRARAQRRRALHAWCGAHIWTPDGLRCVGSAGAGALPGEFC